jgi:HK97 family phage major capsid protein
MNPAIIEYLKKATFTSAGNLQGGSNGGYLNPEQTKEFLRLAVEDAPLLREIRIETSNSPMWEISKLSMNQRIMKPGVEATRLQQSDRYTPTTGKVLLTTVLLKGEVEMSEESLEDNIEREDFADSVAAQGAEAVGRDVEELLIRGDKARTGGEDAYLKLADGIIKQGTASVPTAQKLNAASVTSYESLFAQMVKRMPPKYRRDHGKLRFFTPLVHRDGYQDSLSMRGTTLGDQTVVDDVSARLAFRGIKLLGVPNMSGTDTINSASINYETYALLTDPKNLVAGFQRRIRVRPAYDEHAGSFSWIFSVRVDVKIVDPEAVVFAYNIPFS